MRAWLHLAVLGLVVGALAAWLYYRPVERGETETYALSKLKAADVMRIRLERLADAENAATPPPIELERGSDMWRITAPFAARADRFQVERFLALLDARSAARFSAADLDRYGLERPHARITLGEQSFSVGNVNAATREQYILTNGAVYAIPLAQRTAVPRDPEALIARALFAPDEAPVRIELQEFTAALQDGNWKVAPASGDVSPDDRNAWAARWREALAVRAVRHTGEAPVAAVKIELKDGRRLELGIVTREPELVLLRPDEGIQYHFFADTGKRLFSRP